MQVSKVTMLGRKHFFLQPDGQLVIGDIPAAKKAGKQHYYYADQ